MAYYKDVDNVTKRCPEGYDIVVADNYTLQIDYDQKLLPDNFVEMLSLLRERAGRLTWWKLPSKSGNIHVTIKLADTTMELHERIAWQASFGSDCKREMINLIRVSRGDTRPITFFEKQGLIPECTEVVEGRLFRGEE